MPAGAIGICREGVAELVKLQREFPWPDGVSQTFDVDPMSLS